ncbi:hypothetical protein PBY51_002217 [Eleginops maclovinus]|uniref:Integrase core domain-containing protein n=1 Tax=Eleginops maclovinus TaxID=56733 RepID=A0AAN7WYZ4_ELEMC|nr:hypothetical protein PBY51_002217 [Eleginops maclovinus]
MAIDGYSKKVVGHCTMPVKNNLRIYEEVYRPAVISYGMWDQDRQPYLQTPSTRNHVIERMWVEINERVNYPLKRALIQMTDNEELDMEDNLTRYCVSSLTCQMARIGMENVVNTWNAHRIPGKGIPNQLCGQGYPAKIHQNFFLLVRWLPTSMMKKWERHLRRSRISLQTPSPTLKTSNGLSMSSAHIWQTCGLFASKW